MGGHSQLSAGGGQAWYEAGHASGHHPARK